MGVTKICQYKEEPGFFKAYSSQELILTWFLTLNYKPLVTVADAVNGWGDPGVGGPQPKIFTYKKFWSWAPWDAYFRRNMQWLQFWNLLTPGSNCVLHITYLEEDIFI